MQGLNRKQKILFAVQLVILDALLDHLRRRPERRQRQRQLQLQQQGQQL